MEEDDGGRLNVQYIVLHRITFGGAVDAKDKVGPAVLGAT